MVRGVDEVGRGREIRLDQGGQQPPELQVDEADARVVPAAQPANVLFGDPVQLEVRAQVDGVGMLRGCRLDAVFRQIPVFTVLVPQLLRTIVGEVRPHEVDVQHPRAVHGRGAGLKPVDGRVHVGDVPSPGSFVGTVLLSACHCPFADGERSSLLPLVEVFEVAGAVVGDDRLRETQFRHRPIGMHLADEDGVHVLIGEHGPETVGLRRYAHAVVAIGLHRMDAFPGQERRAARHAERRRAVGVLEHRAVVGQPLHVRGMDEGMAVGRRVARVVLVGHEDDDVGHRAIPIPICRRLGPPVRP